MPPRFVYWTILIDGKPTAFRAHERDELLPTFNQLARKHPDAVMKYFAHGKLWDTPEQARWARENMQKPRERRGPDWRPGGTHKDPRARFDKRRPRQDRPPSDRPPSDRRPPPDRRPPSDRSPSDRTSGGQPRGDRPRKPFDRRPRPFGKTGDGRPGGAGDGAPGSRPPARPFGRPPGRPTGRPSGRPPGRPPRPRGDFKKRR